MKVAFAAVAMALAFAIWPAGSQAQAAAMSHALHTPKQAGNLLTEAGRRYRRHRGYRHHRYHRRHHRHRYYGGPSFSFSFGTPYYGYGYPRYYYPRSYYYVPRRRYYTPRPRRGGRCGYWARKCAQNWGSGGPNWRGCMRWARCN